MLSRVKASCLAAAAMMVLSGAVTAPANAATAQGNIQLVQNDQRDNTRANETRRSSNREVNTNRSPGRELRSDRSSSREISRPSTRERLSVSADRSRERASTRTVVRTDRGDRQRVVIRDRDRDRDHRWSWRHHGYRSYAATSTFVVLGPRVHYAAYGADWCRGLHRGRHWDRRVGWHAGRHYGPFRC